MSESPRPDPARETLPRLLTEAQPLLAQTRSLEDWLTVKEFAALVGMREKSVREAIRKRRLRYRVERLTTGPKATIRIVVPRAA